MAAPPRPIVKHTNALAALAARFREAREAYETVRAELRQAMCDASRDGMRQADIMRAADRVWTREQVRQVLSAERS